METDQGPYATFNRGMADLKARVERASEIEERLDALERERIRLAGRVIKANRKLTREKKDVRELEKPGLLGFLRKLFGGGEKRLRKEKWEVDEAHRKTEAARKDLAPVEEKLLELRAELEELGSFAEEHAALIAGKEEAIAARGGTDAETLARLVAADETARASFELHEECVDKATTASGCLARAAAALGDARSWGRADLFMGSTYTWSEKHDSLGSAKIHAARARASLKALRALLRDSGAGIRIPQVTIGSALSLTDLLFDCAIVDSLVLKRIGTLSKSVRTARNALKPIASSLRRSEKEAAAAHRRARAARRAFVENLA